METMMHNPTATSYEKTFLEVVIPFQQASGDATAAARKNVYPAWMDVGSCGDSSYDLPAGKSEKTGSVTVKYDGVLLGVGGHMHDYGKQIVLQDGSRKDIVATLDAASDAQGHLESMPVKLFFHESRHKFQRETSRSGHGVGLRDGARAERGGRFANRRLAHGPQTLGIGRDWRRPNRRILGSHRPRVVRETQAGGGHQCRNV